MADNIIKVNVTSVKQQRVSVSSSQVGTEITASGDTGRFWAQTAKNWAVADVIVDNTDYSSKHYAQEAKTSAQNASNYEVSIRETAANAVTEIQGVKESAISDIDTTGKSYDNLTHKNITNCITEIPQRITYEFNNGELTINAGSIVTIDGKDYVIPSVPTVNTGTSATQTFIIYEKTRNMLLAVMPSTAGSGTALPTDGSSYAFFFNTTDKKVYRWINNKVWSSEAGYSWPLMIVTRNGVTNQFASIDQVFNGFGYIGSTIWVDKGVKALAPNDKNTDGTLKNYEITTTQISIYTRNLSGNVPLWLNTNGTLFLSAGIAYDEKRNVMYALLEGTTSVRCQVAMTNLTNGVVNSFNLKQPFRVVDYNNFNAKVDEIETGLDTKVNKSGDTITGDLTINKPTNSWPTINIMGKGTMGETSGTLQYGARLMSRDTRKQYFATSEHVIAENGRTRAYTVVRSTNDDGATYSSHRLEVTCYPDGSGGTYIDGKFVKAFVTETYVSGTSWYRVYSDGWCEQGGRTAAQQSYIYEVTLLKAFKNTDYTVTLADRYTSNTNNGWGYAHSYKTSSFQVVQSSQGSSWRACGYIA